MYTRACKVAVLAALVCALLLALPECEANTNRALSRAMSRVFRSPAFSGPGAPRSPVFSGPRASRSPAFSGPRASRSPAFSGPRASRSPAFSGPRASRSPAFSGPRASRSPAFSGPRTFRSPAFSGPTTTGGSSQSIQGPKRLTREECETKGRSLLPSISSDPDIMSCAGSVSDKCCGAVRRQLGKGGPLYGCNCHGGFVQEAVQQAPEFVRAVIYEALAGCSVSC
ncbi:hypothetical protein HOP50_03g25080 [Chloropicon primus]|nr:hypothetical protein HOP50_03g25080 [Chloropicon primus]